MSKISKFIICCIAVILSIVSLCVPTYCSSIDSAPLEFYNIYLNNSIDESTLKANYITPDLYPLYSLTNFNYSFESLGVNGVFCDLNFGTSYPAWVDNIINNFGGEMYETFYPLGSYFSNFRYNVTYKISKWSPDGVNRFINVTITNFVLIDNSLIFSLEPSTNKPSISINTALVPYFVSSNYSVIEYYPYYIGSISYDIINSDNYYYTNSFNMVLKQTGYVESNYISIEFKNSNNLKFSKNFTSVESNNFKKNGYSVTLINNYDSSRTYINSITVSEKFDKIQTSNLYTSSSYMLSNIVSSENSFYRYYFSFFDSELDNVMNGSPLLPIGSNNYYKNAEWWDIPSHLYNFFIYLVFDAPIISNFTNLVMVIINFIVELFDFIIGLFAGINNIFFISIFVGFIVLIFLLKIIFKG